MFMPEKIEFLYQYVLLKVRCPPSSQSSIIDEAPQPSMCFAEGSQPVMTSAAPSGWRDADPCRPMRCLHWSAWACRPFRTRADQKLVLMPVQLLQGA